MSARITEAMLVDVRANASGEHVWCGDDASALEIALGAIDGLGRDDLEDEERRLLIDTAREAWESSREVQS